MIRQVKYTHMLTELSHVSLESLSTDRPSVSH